MKRLLLASAFVLASATNAQAFQATSIFGWFMYVPSAHVCGPSASVSRQLVGVTLRSPFQWEMALRQDGIHVEQKLYYTHDNRLEAVALKVTPKYQHPYTLALFPTKRDCESFSEFEASMR